MMDPLRSDVAGLSLRMATEEDTPRILQFIRDLAEYEKMLDEVSADEERLRKNLFGERRVAEVILADFENEPAGFAIFFHNFSTFLGRPGIYLEDLFVRPEHRGRGIGQELLATLARLAVDRDCGRVEWAVLDWNEPAIGFYEKLGARRMRDWLIYRLSGDALQEMATR